MAYTNDTIQKVWEKATAVEGYDPAILRKDCFGNWIVRNHCGDRDSELAWEIDSINPHLVGDGESLENLRPIQWKKKNLAKFAQSVAELYTKNLMFR